MNKAQKIARLLSMRQHIAFQMQPEMQDAIERSAVDFRTLVQGTRRRGGPCHCDGRAFDLLRADAPIRSPDIAIALGISRRSAESTMYRLKRMGVARIEGGKGGRLCRWYLVPGSVRPVDGRGGSKSRKNLLMGPPARKRPKPLKAVPAPTPYILDELWPRA